MGARGGETSGLREGDDVGLPTGDMNGDVGTCNTLSRQNGRLWRRLMCFSNGLLNLYTLWNSCTNDE